MANLFFPKATILKMESIGINDSDIDDIFNHGIEIKGKNGRYKKYNGYEIRFFYNRNNFTGEYHITGVWKKNRR